MMKLNLTERYGRTVWNNGNNHISIGKAEHYEDAKSFQINS